MILIIRWHGVDDDDGYDTYNCKLKQITWDKLYEEGEIKTRGSNETVIASISGTNESSYITALTNQTYNEEQERNAVRYKMKLVAEGTDKISGTYLTASSSAGVGQLQLKFVVSKLIANLDDFYNIEEEYIVAETLSYIDSGSRRMCNSNVTEYIQQKEDGTEETALSQDLTNIKPGNAGEESATIQMLKAAKVDYTSSMEYDSSLENTNQALITPSTGGDADKAVRVAVVVTTGLVIIGIIVIDAKIARKRAEKGQRPKKPKKR